MARAPESAPSDETTSSNVPSHSTTSANSKSGTEGAPGTWAVNSGGSAWTTSNYQLGHPPSSGASTATSGASTAKPTDTAGLPTPYNEAATSWAQPPTDWTNASPQTLPSAPHEAQSNWQHLDWPTPTGHQTWSSLVSEAASPTASEPSSSAGLPANHERQPLALWNQHEPPPSKVRRLSTEEGSPMELSVMPQFFVSSSFGSIYEGKYS